jgi:hypothetical protein
MDHCTFQSDFRILWLSTFDAIIGMDWLTAFSPMHIDWQHKWIDVPYQGQWIVLQGLGVNLPDKVCFQLCSASELSKLSPEAPQLPPAIQ